MDLLPELDERSVLHVVEENFKNLGLKAFAIRMYYCGEHTLTKEEIISHFRATIRDVNSSYCEIPVNGLLVAYDSYFVHIIEGSEDTVHRQIRFLLKRESDYTEALQQEEDASSGADDTEGLAALEESDRRHEQKIFRRMKMLMVYHSRKKLYFTDWRAVTARPPTLVSRLDPRAPMAEHMEQLRICLDKIKKLIDLAVDDDEDAKTRFRTDFRSDRNKHLTFEGVNAADTRMDALPEVALLDYLLQSPYLLDLRYVSFIHRRVDDYPYYFERVWPLPNHYTPRHLYKLKVDDSFVEPLPAVPWEQKQTDDEERGSGSESSD